MEATALVRLGPAGSASLVLKSCGLAASAAFRAAARPCSVGVVSALVCQYSSSTGEDGNCGDCPPLVAAPQAESAMAPGAASSPSPIRKTRDRFITLAPSRLPEAGHALHPTAPDRRGHPRLTIARRRRP